MILPAYIAWRQPTFIMRYRPSVMAQTLAAD
jgi:hypothetical protein